MGDTVKVQDLDARTQGFLSKLNKARNLPTLRDAIQTRKKFSAATTDGHANGHANGHSNGHANGHAANLFDRIPKNLPGTKFACFGDAGYMFPISYRQDADKFKQMKVRSDDVWIIAYPRSGTTWTEELVWLLNNNLDYEKASKVPLMVRSMFAEVIHINNPTISSQEEMDRALEDCDKFMLSFEEMDEAPSPRFFKTHIPFSLLPANLLDTAKVVCLARDPRDVAVSFYNLHKRFRNFGGDFKTFWNLFVSDLILYTPFFPRLKEAWALRHHPNMLFMFYEDMAQDLPSCIKRMANFFGKQVTDEQIARLSGHLNIDNFRKNKAVNPAWHDHVGNRDGEDYVRKGKVGGWVDYFDVELAEQAQEWIRQNLADTDLRFPASDIK